MADFEKVQYVRQCCFSILPQLYCDRFSITEQIGKIVNALNKLIENNNKLEDYVKEIIREVIESGEIEEIIKDMLANYILNVKFPPEGIEPASGDGSKDDTLAIQGCIDYAFEHGGMAVYFPSGKYLSQSLILKNNVTLFGFDKTTSHIVLKGGALNPLINGATSNNTISGLTLDGNADIQVNNIDLVEITGYDYNFNNLTLTDGYNLLKINLNGKAIISNVEFGNAVVSSLITTGSGLINANQLTFISLSTLSGKYIIDNQVSNSMFNNIYSTCSTQTAIKNVSNNSVFIGQILNAISTHEEIGNNNYYEFYNRGGTTLNLINTEKTNRQNADELLQSNIDSEKTLRENNDEILQNNINNEKTLRENADLELHEDIEKLYFNVNDFGIYGDGVTDYSELIQTLLNDKHFLFFPAGVYVISKRITHSGSCGIIGVGTQLSILKWVNTTGDPGLFLTLSNIGIYSSNTTIKDISILKDTTNNGIAITITGTNTLPDRYTMRPIIENVNIGMHTASAFTNGWKVGIRLIDVNGSVVNKCSITGGVSSTGEPNYDAETGIEITGSGTEPHGTEFLITDCKVSLFKRAIRTNIFEGVVINSGVYLGCNYGVVIDGADKYPHVGITNSHMNCSIRNIWIVKAKEIIVSNNLLYIQNATGNDIASNIEISANTDICLIHGNILNSLTSYRTNGIISSGKYGVVTNNIIETTNNSVPIWLTATSDGWSVRDNTIYNSLPILNQGVNNQIERKTIIPVVSDVPSAPITGEIWFNTSDNKLQIFNGSVVKSVDML